MQGYYKDRKFIFGHEIEIKGINFSLFSFVDPDALLFCPPGSGSIYLVEGQIWSPFIGSFQVRILIMDEAMIRIPIMVNGQIRIPILDEDQIRIPIMDEDQTRIPIMDECQILIPIIVKA